ncbi:hypothetical protein CfE428DRAFT_5755 [Chthoniobacter flavus Ellin428]|uniref:Uncharacterized protein n=2 Tax=Chthoniobacter flavus TaxID=191863 RepID=B4DA15_9BACT|nr:hypothetical protein CfE428DRAFT_5755 [Chthoniobacter flavus Ellin428]TCO87217.1 hypothetical protein EV701_12354 [Chthoniobacter flavus]
MGAFRGPAFRSMNKRKNHFRPGLDFVSEEMVAALLKKPSYDFNGLFEEVLNRLRARNAAGSGKEMLRLRVYEKLRTLVGEGLVTKGEDKTYTGNRESLQTRRAEMAEAKARILRRRGGAVMNVE